jgi:hypothetical protein
MKRLKRALFSGCDATALTVEEEGHGSKAAWRAAKQLRDTIGSMPAIGAPCSMKVRMRMTESAGITAVFSEHCGSLVCAGWRGQL